MKELSGHDRAVITSRWIKTKPEKKGKRIPLEAINRLFGVDLPLDIKGVS